MHVTLNRPDRRHHSPRPLRAAWLMFALAGLISAAQPVQFDEKLRAPAMKNATELRTQAQSMGAKFAALRAATPAQLVTSTTLARQQFDLQWQIQHAIDKHQPLEDLADLGIASRGDGSYSVDLEKHPELENLSRTMAALLSAINLENWSSELLQRGFRPDDIAVLKEYVASHDARAAARAAALPVALGFGRTIRKFDGQKMPVPDDLVFSYWYQSARATAESDRAWAAGLLEKFDAQRGRILVSMFVEMKSSVVWAPDNITAGIPDTLALVRQADFEQRATAEAKGVAP